MIWIEVKVRYEKMLESGKTVKVTEHYLVDALSCTEAEARVTEEVSAFVSGEFSLLAVNMTKIAEIFRDEDGDKWYKVKYNFTIIDEKPTAKGKPAVKKKVPVFTLVQASDFETALANFNNGMNGTLADFEIESIAETKIMDVYSYRANPEGLGED